MSRLSLWQVAEIIAPMAEGTAVELVRLRSLDAKGVTVRTLSVQGESVDSAVATIPPDLLVPPAPPRTPTPKPLASAGVPDTKDDRLAPHGKVDEAWEQSRAPGPAHGHMLEPPSLQGPGRRSPSPSRILPQPQGAPVSTSVAKAMAREAAQRVAESSRVSRLVPPLGWSLPSVPPWSGPRGGAFWLPRPEGWSRPSAPTLVWPRRSLTQQKPS